MSNREIALDTETTGLDPSGGHKIIEIGCIELVNRIPTGRSFHAYINPKRDVPDEAFRIHGISSDFLTDKPVFNEIADDFIEFLGDAKLIIHNAQFDMKFINHELREIEREIISFERAFCTLQEARRRFPGAPASLDALCKRFDIDISARDKHGALLDASLLAGMYLELMGGSQVALELANSSNSSAERESGGEKGEFLAARPHSASQEELASHEEFLKKIKEPLWN